MTNRVTWITSGIQSVFSSSSAPSTSSLSRQGTSSERVTSSRGKRITSNIGSNSNSSEAGASRCSLVQATSDSRRPESPGAMMNTAVVGAPRPPPYEEIASRESNDRQSERRRSSLYGTRINITRGAVESERTSANDSGSRSTSVTAASSSTCTGVSNGLRVPVTASSSSVGTTCDVRRALNGVWASRGSSLMGCFFCCINLYTLSRFSLLAYFFKGKCTTSTKRGREINASERDLCIGALCDSQHHFLLPFISFSSPFPKIRMSLCDKVVITSLHSSLHLSPDSFCSFNSFVCLFFLSFPSGPFLLQFFILSLLYGLPIVLFLSSLGQYLGSGFADLWFISPAFKGKHSATTSSLIVSMRAASSHFGQQNNHSLILSLSPRLLLSSLQALALLSSSRTL